MGANLNINRVLAVFSPQPLKNDFFLDFFVRVTPQEESKCKNAQFLQLILKDDDVYFQKITAYKIWGNSFIVKNIGFYTTCYRHNIGSLGHDELRREACLKYSPNGVNEFESTNHRKSRIGKMKRMLPNKVDNPLQDLTRSIHIKYHIQLILWAQWSFL